MRGRELELHAPARGEGDGLLAFKVVRIGRRDDQLTVVLAHRKYVVSPRQPFGNQTTRLGVRGGEIGGLEAKRPGERARQV